MRKAGWPPRIECYRGVEYVRVYGPDGKRHRRTLGPAGSQEARREYERLVAEGQAQGGRTVERGPDVTVLEVTTAWVEWAREYHCVTQWQRCRKAVSHAVRLYARAPAIEFGPLAYRACIEAFVAEGLSRNYVNALGWCLYDCFVWAASYEMVPASMPAALATVPSLRKGKTLAPETEPVRPARIEDVEKTLPHLSRQVGGLVRFQLATGARPGEACMLRGMDIDRHYLRVGRKWVWLYKLDKHKTDWRGHLRWLPIGPRGQEVLAEFLDGRKPEAYVFDPREARAAWYERTGRAQPKGWKRGGPREHYDHWSYAHAVRDGCDLAGVERWAPNQLRHLVGTQIETEYGREDSRCVLGHRNASTTARYAESVERAARILAQFG